MRIVWTVRVRSEKPGHFAERRSISENIHHAVTGKTIKICFHDGKTHTITKNGK